MRELMYFYLIRTSKLMPDFQNLPGKNWSINSLERKGSKLPFRFDNIKHLRALKSKEEMEKLSPKLDPDIQGNTAEDKFVAAAKAPPACALRFAAVFILFVLSSSSSSDVSASIFSNLQTDGILISAPYKSFTIRLKKDTLDQRVEI
uniref:Uncharacterized protein n=1 Tax=Romanomermis culicivorax TaxID=13658 RepID=A0A915L0W0_ROMCU